MSSRQPQEEVLNHRLYRHRLSRTMLFDLLVTKGIVTRDEITHQAQPVRRPLWRAVHDTQAP